MRQLGRVSLVCSATGGGMRGTCRSWPSYSQNQGIYEVQSVLILAGPGTGKTWSTQQLTYELAQRAQKSQMALRPLPLLVHVQRMVSVIIRTGIDAVGSPRTMLVEYIKKTHDGEECDVLLQESRSAGQCFPS
jgi:Cdc6-like AAA superfamily ATPase